MGRFDRDVLMPRVWTDEQRQAARERVAARGGVGAKAATADPPSAATSLAPLPGEILRPDGKPARPSEIGGAHVLNQSEMFALRMKAGQPITTDENMALDSDERQVADSTNIQHTSSGLVRLYKKQNWGGWLPHNVSKNSVVDCLQAGEMDHCPDCFAYCGEDVNDCPGRAKIPYIPCPVCGKRFYDTALPETKPTDAADAFMVQGTFADSTPVLRMQAQANDHMIWYHEQSATMYGLRRPAVALQ